MNEKHPLFSGFFHRQCVSHTKARDDIGVTFNVLLYN